MLPNRGKLIRMWQHLHFDTKRALILIGVCVVLYSIIFSVFFSIGSAKSATPERMIGIGLDDVNDYVGLAHVMLETGRFALTPDSPPEFFRTPGYPAFLALVLIIFGTVLASPFFQVLFTALAVALVYLIGVRYFSRTVALIAAIVYMFDPLVMYPAWALISESLFMVLLLASVYTIGIETRGQWLPFVVAGILIGLAALVRPVAFYLIPLIACMALAHSVSWRTTLRGAGIFLATAGLVMSPWMLRNYTLSGHFEVSTTGIFNLFYYDIPLFEQTRTGTEYREIQKDLGQRAGTTSERALQSFAYSDRETAVVLEELRKHPIQYVLFHIVRSEMLFIGSSINSVSYHLYQHGIMGQNPAPIGAWGMILEGRWNDALIQTFSSTPKLLERLFWVFAYFGVFYTVITSIWRRSSNMLWIIAAFILIHAIAVLAGPLSDDTRYRIPAEPFILLLAINALFDLSGRIRSWRRPQAISIVLP